MKNRMFKKYLVKWVLRLLIFVSVFLVYLLRRDLVLSFVNFRLFGHISPLHLLWGVLMYSMLAHMFSLPGLTMGHRKMEAINYVEPAESYDRLKLLEHVQKMNIRAWKVMLVWLIFNSIFAALYLLNVLDAADLIMLSVFYFLCDMTCILMFCPFQVLIMKNRCCVNCRIFDWGHFMMFTPLLFIKSFFTWSLFFTACIVLIRWEFAYAKHPERYWNRSNSAIRCENCQDKLCTIKKPLRDVYERKVDTKLVDIKLEDE